jgi:hypothetical protein
MTSEDPRRNSEAGFILPDAALPIRDGWTLEAAVRARYPGIAEEDWRPRLE